MKIISKYKDYYDYLIGFYGIDEKLVLDRTSFTVTEVRYPTCDDKITFLICGYQVDCLYRNGKFYYSKDIEQFNTPERDKGKWYYWHNRSRDDNYIVKMNGYRYGNSRNSETTFLKLPTKTKVDINESLNCPILLVNTFGSLEFEDNKYSPFPILKDYNFSGLYSPEEIWLMLYNFLSKTRDIPNIQTDKEKIISKGFDYIHSFRNTK